MEILITGSAGFIGFHLTRKLLALGHNVIGVDNLNDYYDVNLKIARNKILLEDFYEGHYRFKQIDIASSDDLESVFRSYTPSVVINLAAQAGVRYSLINPQAYIQANVLGFTNILENCRHYKVQHLIYASSSSVYGGNTSMPFHEDQSVNHPVSLYAASKKSNELMAHVYSHLFDLPTTGLRFFTVYGPYGRPDMALFLFTKAILEGRPIDIFNNGNMVRDFTYVDDIVESVARLVEKPAAADPSFNTAKPLPSRSWSPYRLFNIGNSDPVPLMDYIAALESALDIKAIKNYLPMQPGDVAATASSTQQLSEWINFAPKTSISTGVANFVEWYRDYYNLRK